MEPPRRVPLHRVFRARRRPDGDPIRPGRHQSLGKTQTILVIAVAAVLQILVHLRFSGTCGSPPIRENLFAIAFTAVLVVLMVGGSGG